MGVLALWRYPVKAMLGELLDAARVTASGLDGDRRWIVVDEDTGERIANKRGPTDLRLRACRATLGDDGELEIVLPGGEQVAGADAGTALSDLLERRVRLEPGSHHDFAPIHFLTTRTLAHLRALEPEIDWDPRRFRANVIFDDGEAPGAFTEDAMLGRELRGSSGVRVRVQVLTPRCVVPTRASEELAAQPDMLRILARHHLRDLEGFELRGVCAGAYAQVEAEGRIAVGERMRVAGL